MFNICLENFVNEVFAFHVKLHREWYLRHFLGKTEKPEKENKQTEKLIKRLICCSDSRYESLGIAVACQLVHSYTVI